MKKEISKPEKIEKQAEVIDTVPNQEPEQVNTADPMKITPIATPIQDANVEKKLCISYLKRQLQSKAEQISRNEKKVDEWIHTGQNMIETAKDAYELKKLLIEEQLAKLTERHEVKVHKVQKNWIDYSYNFRDTKISTMKEEFSKIETELLTLEPTEQSK